MSKLLSFDTLIQTIQTLKKDSKTIVHCHGVFDLLHIGHIKYFEEAKSMGDILVVTLTEDRYVNKGPNRPAFNHHLRAEAIVALACVDFVAINQWPTAIETLEKLQPTFYVKGPDYKQHSNDLTGNIVHEKSMVEQYGGQIAYTTTPLFSSSSLINNYFSV